MKANPQYWLDGQPKLAGIEMIFFNDDTAMVDALRGGQVDLVMRLATPLYDSLQGDPEIETISIPSNKFDVVRLRSDRAPGSDPRVIQAFKLATDRNALFELVQQGYGAVGRDSPIGPLYPAFYSEAAPIPARDVTAAKELLTQAGYPEGLNLVLHTPDTENRPDLAAVLKNQWAEAGINIEILVEPESVYYGDNGWLEVDLGITGWGSRPYPQFYLEVMLTCDAKWNEAHFCDPEFDEWVRVAGTTQDENERVKAYHEIQRVLIERGPLIIPYFSATNAAIRSEFKDFELKAFPGRTDLRLVSQ
jgi:peptide/nickel transport system substrate-binding protein